MLQGLYDSIEALLICVVLLNFAVSEVACFIGFGGSRLLAPFGGSLIGLLLVWIFKLEFFWGWVILSCIVTIVLSVWAVPMLLGKLDDVVGKKLEKIEEKMEKKNDKNDPNKQ